MDLLQDCAMRSGTNVEGVLKLAVLSSSVEGNPREIVDRWYVHYLQFGFESLPEYIKDYCLTTSEAMVAFAHA